MCRPATRSLGDAVPAAILVNLLPELRRACSRPTSNDTITARSRPLRRLQCQAEAIAWNERLGEATRLGYNVALVTYDSVAELARFSKRHEIAYPILSDRKSEIIRAFDIMNEEHEPGSRAYGIPHPIIFVVDSRGIVRLRFSEDHYRDRPEIDRVLETIRKQTR